MKIRQDFVTNSSSSSFIIGTEKDDISVEIVFNMLKAYYKEFLSKKEILASHAKELGIHWNEEYKSFEFDEDDIDKYWEKDEKLEKEYGISTYDGFYHDYSILDFDTYKDYEAYWIKYIEDSVKADKKNKYGYYAPFSIVDYSYKHKAYRIDEGIIYNKQKITTENIPLKATDSDIYGWYVPCESAFYTDDEYKEYCGDYDRDSFDYCHSCSVSNKRGCRIKKAMKNGELTNENAIITVLGKICIHSESGRIPDYVVNKLRAISRYSCNHMG